MKNLLKTFSLAAIGIIAVQLPSQAENAVRAAYAEVRPNGSSFAAALEVVVPDALAVTNIEDPALVLTIDDAGTNQSYLEEMIVDNVTFSTDGVGIQTLEAAIARAIDLENLPAEDLTGYIRAFVGPDGFSNSDASATLD
jgi:hypothetical protein